MAWKQRVIRDLPCRPKWIHNNHHDIMSTVTIKRVIHGLVSITSELWKEPWAEFDTTDTLWVIEVSSTTVSGTMEVVLSPGLLSLLMMKWWDSYPRNHHRKKKSSPNKIVPVNKLSDIWPHWQDMHGIKRGQANNLKKQEENSDLSYTEGLQKQDEV